MDLYEREFGIYNHGPSADNPLSSVLFHTCEDVWMDSRLRDLIETFAVHDIGRLWNMSLPEFLALPIPYVEMIMKLRDPVSAKKDRALNDVVRGMGSH